MKITATKKEITECFNNAMKRVMKEAALVGFSSNDDDEADDGYEEMDNEPLRDDYSNDEDDFGVANPDADDTANMGDLESDNDELSDYVEGEKPLDDADDDNLADGPSMDVSTDLDTNADAELIADLDQEFGEHSFNTSTGEVIYTIPNDRLDDFRDVCDAEDIEITSQAPINESCMPIEPFKVTTTGKVFWINGEKPVENVNTYKFRMDESYRKQCWKNFQNKRFVM